MSVGGVGPEMQFSSLKSSLFAIIRSFSKCGPIMHW